jgi:Glycosyltransferase family 87
MKRALDSGLHPRQRPPLWLAAATVASGWAAAYTIVYWILAYKLQSPIHYDFRIIYVGAEAGVQHGWSAIYDSPTLRALSRSFPIDAQLIDSGHTYDFPPLVAWLVAPLTVFSEPVAYLLWTLFSLGALLVAWHIACPYEGLAKFTLLLVAIGIWPNLEVFYLGQPLMLILAALAVAWWLCSHERPIAAGLAIALATFLKPQVVVLLPIALAVSGRYRVLAGWLIGCTVLGVVTVIALEPSGLASWWRVVRSVEEIPLNYEGTAAHLLGNGPVTYAVWAVQGLAALVIARWRRLEVELVFAAGILGSAAVAFHFHAHDYGGLVLAGWLVLRSHPPLWQQLWLLAGILPLQLIDYAWGALDQPFWDGATRAPLLIYDAAWIGILLFTSFKNNRLALAANRYAVVMPEPLG